MIMSKLSRMLEVCSCAELACTRHHHRRMCSAVLCRNAVQSQIASACCRTVTARLPVAHLLGAVVLVVRWHVGAGGLIPLGGVAPDVCPTAVATTTTLTTLSTALVALVTATATATAAAAACAQAVVVVLHEALVAGAKAFLQVSEAAAVAAAAAAMPGLNGRQGNG
jgi:hypothetical protein